MGEPQGRRGDGWVTEMGRGRGESRQGDEFWVVRWRWRWRWQVRGRGGYRAYGGKWVVAGRAGEADGGWNFDGGLGAQGRVARMHGAEHGIWEEQGRDERGEIRDERGRFGMRGLR